MAFFHGFRAAVAAACNAGEISTIDHDYIPAPCGAMICYREGTLAESRRLDSSAHFFAERRSMQMTNTI